MKPRDRANELLAEIKRAEAVRDELAAEVNKAVQAVKDNYAERLTKVKDRLTAGKTALVKLMKDERGDLFTGRNNVDLQNGVLVYDRITRVVIPTKNEVKAELIAAIEARGWADGLLIEKSLNREIIAAWPDVRLADLGLAKKTEDSFTFEVKAK